MWLNRNIAIINVMLQFLDIYIYIYIDIDIDINRYRLLSGKRREHTFIVLHMNNKFYYKFKRGATCTTFSQQIIGD